MLSVSKSGSLVSVSLIITYLLFFASASKRLLWFIILIVGTFYVYNIASDIGVLTRFSDAMSVVMNLQERKLVADYSTFTRLVEIRGAVSGLENSQYYPLSYLIGLGSGATWFSNEFLSSGLAIENYRSNGGVHHIHVEYFSLLFRHGVVGLIMYLILLTISFKRAIFIVRKCRDGDRETFAIAGSIALVMVGYATYSLSDTGIYGKFSVGMLAAIASVLANQKRLRRLSND